MSIAAGDSIPAWEMPSVSAEKMKTMAAILRDPNPLHWDREAVAALPLGLGHRTINQGPLGLGYIINMLHAWQGPECVKHIYVRFPAVVLDGDHVTARGTVAAVEDGVAACEVWLENADGRRCLEGRVFVQLKEN